MKAKYFNTLIILTVFAIFMVYPVGFVLVRAFLDDGGLTLRYFALMLESQYFQEVIANSLNFAITVTALCSITAYPIALLMCRYELPYKRVLHTLLLLPLILPPFVGVLGVRQIFGYFGTINSSLIHLGLLEEPIRWLGVNQYGGVIVLQVVHLVPILYLSISASLKNSHRTLEEAAAVCGASPWRVLTSITLPLSFPGWFAGSVMVFIASFTDLGTPLLFEYRHVIPVQIFNMLSDLNENRVGYSFVVFTCVICISLFFLARGASGRAGYSTGGRIQNLATLTPLSPLARCSALALLALYITITLLPHAGVLLLSISERWFMTALPERLTLNHYLALFSHPLTLSSMRNSVMLSVIATALTVVIGSFIAFMATRAKDARQKSMGITLETLTLIPLVVPGIVFAFGYVGAFAGTWLDSRVNPFPLLVAAYLIRRSPYMVRSVSAGLSEVSTTMEEAAATLGAPPLRVARLITVPLMLRHIIAGALLTFVYCVLEVSDGLLLALEEKFYPVSKAMYALMARPDGVELASALGVVVMICMGSAFFLAEYLLNSQPHRPIDSIKAARARSMPAQPIGSSSCMARSSTLQRAMLGVTFFGGILAGGSISAENRELVLVSPHWEGIKREFARAFQEHRKANFGEDVELRWLDVGGTADIVKYVSTQFSANPVSAGIDVMFGGGSDSYIELEAKGLLASVRLDEQLLRSIPEHIQGLRLRGEDNSWFSVSLSTFGILYNSRALSLLGVPPPTTWASLARPEYYGLLGAGDPRKSGSMHAIFEIILQGYGWRGGWDIIRRIAVNVRNFSGSATQVGKELTVGEVVIGVIIDSSASELIRHLGDDALTFVVPTDYPALSGDSIAVLRGAPNKELAEDFVRFTLSPKGQRLLSAKKGSPDGPQEYQLGKLPVLPSLFEQGDLASEVKGNPFLWPSLLDYDTKLGAARWNLVNDLFGAFIIDVHDRLREVTLFRASESQDFPISLREAEALLSDPRWRKDPGFRSSLLTKWGDKARAEFQAGQPEGGILSQLRSSTAFRWIPSILFLLFLMIAYLSTRKK